MFQNKVCDTISHVTQNTTNGVLLFLYLIGFTMNENGRLELQVHRINN